MRLSNIYTLSHAPAWFFISMQQSCLLLYLIPHMKKLLTAAVLVLLFVPTVALAARQPRVVEGDVVTEVQNPDIAQDFFGVLSGEPEFFLFSIKQEQELYLSLRVMQGPSAATDLSGSLVTPEGVILAELDGGAKTWEPMLDETTGVTYLHGPETHIVVEPGDYLFGVSSLNNDIPYVFAVGEREVEPGGDVVSAFTTLASLRDNFLDREVWEAYINQAGGPIVVGTIAAVLFGLISLLFLWRFFR